jgi:hypothetical protein
VLFLEKLVCSVRGGTKEGRAWRASVHQSILSYAGIPPCSYTNAVHDILESTTCAYETLNANVGSHGRAEVPDPDMGKNKQP